MKQYCKGCKYWIPDQSSWVVKAQKKYPGPCCGLNGELARSDQTGCLVWTPVKKEQEENR